MGIIYKIFYSLNETYIIVYKKVRRKIKKKEIKYRSLILFAKKNEYIFFLSWSLFVIFNFYSINGICILLYSSINEG